MEQQNYSADSFRASDSDRPHPFPVQAIHQRHQLDSVQLNPDMADPRPAEPRLYQALCIKADPAAVPPYNLDSIGSFHSADLKCPVQRVLPLIANNPHQSTTSLS